jgi:hypothetical protein
MGVSQSIAQLFQRPRDNRYAGTYNAAPETRTFAQLSPLINSHRYLDSAEPFEAVRLVWKIPSALSLTPVSFQLPAYSSTEQLISIKEAPRTIQNVDVASDVCTGSSFSLSKVGLQIFSKQF